MRAVKHRRRLSREAIKSPVLNIAQNLTGPDPSGSALEEEVGLDDFCKFLPM